MNNEMSPLKTTTLFSKESTSRLSVRRGLVFATLALGFACVWLSPTARGVVPAPDGYYPPANSNTAEGFNALFSNPTGSYNTAVGLNALYNDTTGGRNTGIGVNALRFNMSGGRNTAVGTNALYQNTANNNTAVGDSALFANTTGPGNTASGASALYSNTIGNGNTATGFYALYYNLDGNANTAMGIAALLNNSQGDANTAVGAFALLDNTFGIANTATGYQALTNNAGSLNTANGGYALAANTSGSENTAMGYDTILNNTTGSQNTAVGLGALDNNTTGSGNIALGYSAGHGVNSGSNNIFIGNLGGNGSNSIYIGNPEDHFQTFIAGIYGTTAIGGLPVYISAAHKLGTTTSSKRFKEDIKPMDKASEALLALQPVTFRYKKEIDPAGTAQFGLVAEDVEKVNPDLVVCDKEGKPYTVRYDQVNAMLLNEFLKEHRKVAQQASEIQEQKAMIAELKSAVTQQHKASESKFAEQRRQIEALASGLHKVSVQLELQKQSAAAVANY